jgi:hypothetical protein
MDDCGQILKHLVTITVLVYNWIMKTNRRRGPQPANPEQPITLTLGFAASEADRELVERLTVAMGAPSLSAAIREAVRNEYARLSK